MATEMIRGKLTNWVHDGGCNGSRRTNSSRFVRRAGKVCDPVNALCLKVHVVPTQLPQDHINAADTLQRCLSVGDGAVGGSSTLSFWSARRVSLEFDR